MTTLTPAEFRALRLYATGCTKKELARGVTPETMVCTDESWPKSRYGPAGTVHIPGCWACVIGDHDSCTCEGSPNAIAMDKRYRALTRLRGMQERRRMASAASDGLTAFPVPPPGMPYQAPTGPQPKALHLYRTSRPVVFLLRDDSAQDTSA